MQRTRSFFSATLALALTIATIGAGFSTRAQQRAYRVSEQQVDQLLGRIESRSAQFRRSLYNALNRTPIDGTRQEDNINEFVRNFETATATLRDRFRGRRDIADDVREVLNRAAYIDGFMRRHNLDATTEEDWRSLRSDLDVLADYYNVTSRWDSAAPIPARPGSPQQRAYRVTEQQVDQLLGRIESRSSQFRRSLYDALNRTPIDGTRQEDNINEFVRNFETATATLRDRFRGRRDIADDVREVLNRAAYIDGFMRRHNLAASAEEDWRALRSDLDVLADYYNVTWGWDNNASTPGRGTPGRDWPGRNSAANRLTGTYRLDATKSDDVWRVAQRTTRGTSEEERQRLRNLIERRLAAPEMLAIERRGRNVTVASSRAPQVTFEADGRDKVEEAGRGRTVRVNATLNGDQLVVSSTGERGNDFRVTFDVLGNGQQLQVTRSIDIEGLTRPAVVNSIYNRTSEVAQLNLPLEPSPVRGNPPGGNPPRGPYTVADGAELMATLNNGLSTRQAREGDRFSLTVRSPSSYDGAIIEGYVSGVQRSTRVSGRPQLTFNFERIRMRNGQTYSFDGYIQSVRALNGDTVRVDNEGSISEKNSQTTETVAKTGIGAAIGALIGAVAGGGKGAAIGAAVGAGAGAGSVFIQGRDDLDLASGTEFTIRATAPRNRDQPGR
jgi:outer membrane lipoprotein SlyB/head-tail adaptor